jgi:hypothetical protein
MRTPLPGQLAPMEPKGPQPFVDWRYVRAGFVGWYAGDQRVGVWEEAPANTIGVPKAPFGIRLQAQTAECIGPIIARDKPWEYTYHINTVMYDEGVYRAWCECIPSDHFEGGDLAWPLGHGNVMAYVESDDGFNWRKPELGIYDYHGKPSNIVYGRNLSPNGQHGATVFKDPQAPAAERYKMIYMGTEDTTDMEAWKAKYRGRFGDDMDPMCFRKATGVAQRVLNNVSGHLEKQTHNVIYWMGGATSPDGLHWTGLKEPLMVHFSDTMTTCYWDEALQEYVGYFRTWLYGRRCIGRASTKDYSYWPETPDTVVQPPLGAHPSDDVYLNAKMIYPGSGNVHLMFPAMYHRVDDSREPHLASSIDGIHWQWVPGGPVIQRGKLGDWNGSDVAATQGIVPLAGNRIAVPMAGYVHPHKYPRGSTPFGAPGWATWTKGRLCALVADEYGEFNTPDLIFSGNELSLNLRTREAGSVRAELRDEANQPIPGFTFADADPIAADTTDRRVSWHGNAAIGQFAGKSISVAFQLRMAELFAFEFV